MNLVCPKRCGEVMKQCANNADCKKRQEYDFKECASVRNWDGNSTKPNCTSRCKELFQTKEKHPIIRPLKCCTLDEDDQMNITLKRKNMETLCGMKLYNFDECQNREKACENIRSKEDNIDHTGIHRLMSNTIDL